MKWEKITFPTIDSTSGKDGIEATGIRATTDPRSFFKIQDRATDGWGVNNKVYARLGTTYRLRK